MKYSEKNKPLVCMLTNSTCYKGTYRFKPKGVLWHCTGANNPNIWRYVQPSSNDPNRDALLEKIGRNNYGSDWNRAQVQAGVNAWIGKIADGSVTSVQALPWDFRPWGCGGGWRGSCNDTHIQFEMCEDALVDRDYFEKCYREGVELTAYLCKLYGIDPYGHIIIGGAKIPTILCHKDSFDLGVGTGHGDVYNWFNRYGRTMDDVRDDVAKLIGNSAKTDTDPAPATPTPTPAADELYRVRKTWADAKSQIGAYKVLANAKSACTPGYTVFDSKGNAVYTNGREVPVNRNNFTVKVTAKDLNIRSGPGAQYKVNTVIPPGVYTIVEQSGSWGKLKSGAGWINLDYVTKL